MNKDVWEKRCQHLWKSVNLIPYGEMLLEMVSLQLRSAAYMAVSVRTLHRYTGITI